ncbi:MAG TPA: 16S rRNA (adenine(1518)-N(6)/adenine(1519)-N(6))-dimethyltransferase RsmA [Thiotrichales bacterium]|nr:16S rRNA (adenine(1518)-N(6)/adenine(1519)-N(6))-dimethyltransferase RsmA [Thiotrichales bacterium]
MHHQAKKRFGQNFLVDKNIIQRIVSSINPQADDLLIEIGPGLGAMTKPVLEKVDHLHVIELDRDVIPKLLANIGNSNRERLSIHQADVLKFDFSDFHRQQGARRKLRVIGNLPYNISTPVLFHLLKNRDIIHDMHFMLQKEVVDRIAAAPGSSTYGRLSVMIQAFFQVTPLFNVSPYAFRPAPKVDSAILRLAPDERFSRDIADFKHFETLVRSAFSQRRKTLKNTLKKLCDATRIEAAGLDPGQRAETLSVADFVRLNRVVDQ